MSVSVHSVQTGRISVSSSNIRSGSLFIYLQASRVGTQTSAHRLPRSSGKEAKKCAKLVAHCSQPRAAADDSNLCSTTTECPRRLRQVARTSGCPLIIKLAIQVTAAEKHCLVVSSFRDTTVVQEERPGQVTQ